MKTITTQYKPPTDTLPSRYVAVAEDYGNKKSAVVFIDHELNDGERSDKAVLKLAKEMGWEGVMVRGHMDADRFVYVFEQDHHLTLEKKDEL